MTTHFGPTMIAKQIQSLLVCSLALSMPLAPSTAGAQAPSEEASAPIRVYIETDTKALGERGLGMQGAVIREMRGAFEAAGVELLEPEDEDPNAVRLRIRFTGNAEDVDVYDYELNFELIDGKTATQLIEPVACPKCVDAVLYEKLHEQVSPLVEAIKAETATNTDGSDSTPPSGDGDGDPATLPPKPIGVLGGMGIGVAAVGLGVTIAGAVQWSRGRVPEIDLTRPTSEGLDYTPQGKILVGVGVGTLVVGAVMLGVDLGLRAKQRRKSNYSVVPTFGPQQAGISFHGRF